MGFHVNILDSAVEDIEQLLSYLQARWGDSVAGQAYVELMDKLALLETQPHLGNPNMKRLLQRLLQYSPSN